MHVHVQNLKRYFGKTRAVDGITFSFESGQIVGFIGPNGAGKTTTMRILATSDEPTSGDATFDGISVVEYPDKVRKLVGFMPDYLPTHRDITVREYLDFFARAFGLGRERRRRVIDGIEAFTNLAGLRDKTIKSLSKGMKQRVNLARALVHDPPVLVLDEPAGGLDPRARVELRELLKVLAEKGKALLVSSHILTELSEICDSTVIIEQGKIVRAGRLDEIIDTDMPLRVVHVRSPGHEQAVAKAVLEMPNVTEANIAGQWIEVAVEGGEDACQGVLTALMQQGHPVAEFKHQKANLEELFMNLTKGQVQ